jgi:hypothetical protein
VNLQQQTRVIRGDGAERIRVEDRIAVAIFAQNRSNKAVPKTDKN